MNNQPKQPNFLRKCYKALRLEIKILFWISLIMLLLIELLFKRWHAPSREFFALGDIFLKLCYSFVASVIFYFVNVHYPKELKKQKALPMIIQTLKSIVGEILTLSSTICESKAFIKMELTLPNFDKGVKELKLDDKPLFIEEDFSKSPVELDVPNWIEYSSGKLARLDNNCKFLFTLHDLVDSEILTVCTRILRDAEIIRFGVAGRYLQGRHLFLLYEDFHKLKKLFKDEYGFEIMKNYISK